MSIRLDAVKFITTCDIMNCKHKYLTHTYIFICSSDKEMNVTYLWKVLAFQLYNSLKNGA